MRVSTTAVVAPVDIDTLRALVPSLLRRWRALEFGADGVAVVDGARHPGLRLGAGRHPSAGAVYRLHIEEPAAESFEVEVLRDDTTELRLRLRELESATSTVLAVEQPGAASRMAVDVEASAGTSRWVGGAVRIHGEVAVDAIPGGAGRPQVAAVVEHRRVELRVQVSIRAGEDGWDVEVVADTAGRGPLGRALLFIARPFVRRFAARTLAGVASGLPDTVEQLKAVLLDDQGRRRPPSDIADELFSSLLDLVAPAAR